MIYTLKNDKVTAKINSRGAELYSLVKDGWEYIWQGDETYWGDRAPMMFPICGRCYEGKYTYKGKTYEMGGHGFLRTSETVAEQIDDTELRLTLTSNDETRAIYPFDFSLTVRYLLVEAVLRVSFEITNTGKETLPVTCGGHPGFNLPFEGKGSFEDCYLEFDEPCSPNEMVLAGVYNSGLKRGITLKEGKRLPLTRELFALEALFIDRMAKGVTLRSAASERYVYLNYPDANYLGIWQPAKGEPPFVCLEPWCGFPAHDGITDDFETKSDMFRLPPASVKEVTYSIAVG